MFRKLKGDGDEYTLEEIAEHRRLWIQALRSGLYKQATGKLRDGDDRFCCLGVACNISGLFEWEDDGDSYLREWVYGDETGVLPALVRKALGLGSTTGVYHPDYYEMRIKASLEEQDAPGRSLTIDNDCSVGFSEIAEVIEQDRGILSTSVDVHRQLSTDSYK